MNFRINWKWIFLALSIFLLDASLKMYVHHFVAPMTYSYFPYGGIGVFNKFGIEFVITHVINKGAMWGLFSNYQFLLVITRIAIIAALGYYLCYKQMSNYRRACLVVILVGAIGNVFDSIVYGHVIDMFCLIFWGYVYPIFNIADAVIFCGILLMLLEPSSSILVKRPTE
jgi:signal peptidase II